MSKEGLTQFHAIMRYLKTRCEILWVEKTLSIRFASELENTLPAMPRTSPSHSEPLSSPQKGNNMKIILLNKQGSVSKELLKQFWGPKLTHSVNHSWDCIVFWDCILGFVNLSPILSIEIT